MGSVSRFEISLLFFNTCHSTVMYSNHLVESCPSVDREAATLVSEETMIRTNGYSLTCFAYLLLITFFMDRKRAKWILIDMLHIASTDLRYCFS